MIFKWKSIYSDKRKLFLLGVVILLASFFSFWKSGKHSLYEWDESRYGMIAYQMIQHHDFINYYFLDEIDPTVYKPPLSFWAIAASYKIFGANEFALRFPSAISTILFFIFFFLWICIYQTEITALLSCLVLLGVKGIIGKHIGRTGDTEAMLICFQMISVYYFSCYTDKNKNNAIVYSGVFTALAFLTKGIAGLFFLPSLLIYCLLRKKIESVFRDKYFWYSVFSFILIIGIWVFLIFSYGDVNFLKKMFSVDVIGRMIEKENTNFYYRNDPWFVFPALDILFNLWNYLFYFSILIFVLLKIKNRRKIFSPDDHILWICFSIILSLSIILTVAKTSAEWYFFSLVPFCAVVTIVQLDGIKWKPIRILIYGLLIFTISRNFIVINEIPADRGQLLKNNRQLIEGARKVYWYNPGDEQDFFLYITWYKQKFYVMNHSSLSTIDFEKGEVIVGKDDFYLKHYLFSNSKLNFRESEEYFILSKN